MSTKPTFRPSGGARGPGSATAAGVHFPLTETPDTYGAYPRLSDARIEALAALGQRLGVQPDQVMFRGQAGTSSRIGNCLGFPSGISGAELADRAVLQARKFGARSAVPATAASIGRDNDHYTVRLDDGAPVTARSVVIATGALYRLPRLEHSEQVSIYYAAFQAEGARHTSRARALFVVIRVTPCTGWQRSVLETSQPGMFAAGDVRSGSVKRVAAAVGEGAMAIRLALERMQSYE